MYTKDVFDFRYAIGKECRIAPTKPPEQETRLAVELVLEEALELADACFQDDGTLAEVKSRLLNFCRTGTVEVYLPEVADALADIKYVTFGADWTFGIKPGLIWDIVHLNNMLKVSGPDDPVTGKRMKPAGFVGPGAEIRQSLLIQGWDGK